MQIEWSERGLLKLSGPLERYPAARLPTWDLISLDDKAIPPAAQRYMAQQAGAHITAIHSAHDSLITHPLVVDALIVQAAASIMAHQTR